MNDAKAADRRRAIIRMFIPRMMGVEARYSVNVVVIIISIYMVKIIYNCKN